MTDPSQNFRSGCASREASEAAPAQADPCAATSGRACPCGATAGAARRAARRAPRSAAAKRRPVRGVAVVLALVAVSVATMLGVAYAASRDATLATSGRLRESAAARAAAAGALEVAGAIVADPDLCAELGVLADEPLVATRVLDALAVGDATVRAELVDLATGGPASQATRAAELVVEATVGAVRERARAVGRLPQREDAAEADLDGSEFAILAGESLAVRGESVVGLWRASPLAALAEPVRFGTASGDGLSVAIDRRAAVHGCVALRRGGFPRDGDAADDQLASGEVRVPAAIHLPKAPLPPEPATRSPGDVALDGLLATSLAPAGDARVPARASLTVRGAETLDIGGNLFIERGARVLVESPLVVVVRGNLVLDACSVECARGATLAIIACGDATVAASYLGGARADADEGRDASGLAGYDGGAEQVVLFSRGDGRVLVTDGSVVKGQVYAPEARVELAVRSAVYGRLLGREVTLADGVALFYDPALDSGAGWTQPASGLWRADGSLEPAVLLVESLDAAPILAFAAATGVEPVLAAPLVPAIEAEIASGAAAAELLADGAPGGMASDGGVAEDAGADDAAGDATTIAGATDDASRDLARIIEILEGGATTRITLDDGGSRTGTDAGSGEFEGVDANGARDGDLAAGGFVAVSGGESRARAQRWSRLARLVAEVRSRERGWRRSDRAGFAGFITLGFEGTGPSD